MTAPATPPEGLGIPLTRNAPGFAVDAVYSKNDGQLYALVNGVELPISLAGGGSPFFGVFSRNLNAPGAGVLTVPTPFQPSSVLLFGTSADSQTGASIGIGNGGLTDGFMARNQTGGGGGLGIWICQAFGAVWFYDNGTGPTANATLSNFTPAGFDITFAVFGGPFPVSPLSNVNFLFLAFP